MFYLSSVGDHCKSRASTYHKRTAQLKANKADLKVLPLLAKVKMEDIERSEVRLAIVKRVRKRATKERRISAMQAS